MLSKTEFLAALKRETKIITHLAGKLGPQHLDFRLTPAQRSTSELLRYLTITLEAGTGYLLTGSWDHWNALEERSKTVELSTFAAAMKRQESAIAKQLKPISDRAFTSKKIKAMWGGGPQPLSQALSENVLGWAAGYRMQLFLQAKAAGLAGLESHNLWAGKDPKKSKKAAAGA